jgi:hypothetical protein
MSLKIIWLISSMVGSNQNSSACHARSQHAVSAISNQNSARSLEIVYNIISILLEINILCPCATKVDI